MLLSESGQAAVVYTLVDSATSELQQQAAAASVTPDTSNTTSGHITTPVPTNSHVVYRLSESGQAAVVYTLVDSATSELQQQAAAASVTPEPSNTTSGQVVTIPLTLSDAPSQSNDTQYIVRAEPRQDSQPPPQAGEKDTEEEKVVEGGDVRVGVTEETNDTVAIPPTPPPQEDIPSFSEWAQKQLAEAEKKKGENATGGGGGGGGVKVRHSKNYASPDCGAKVVGSNPEAVSAGAVLSSSRDEYLLNTCTSRTWFIVEMCEAIQPKKVDIANFELFSSSPKEFSVYLSDRYPTRDWAVAGRFTAQDERNVQSFNLSHSSHFGKYVKVEVHSHYGQEHYCPVSLFRVYGTSEIEVLDTVDEGHPGLHGAMEDDDDVEVVGEGGEGGAPKNLFGSARDAVLSIVKKAAEALAKSPGEGKGNSTVLRGDQLAEPSEPCVTPSHIAVCVNCSDEYYHRMYDVMSCRVSMLSQLLQSPFVRRAVTTSEFCAERGLDLRTGAPFPPRPGAPSPLPIHYLEALLPSETIAALCNLLAVAQKKVVLNISREHVTEQEAILETDEPTPALPDSTVSVVDSNISEDIAGTATRVHTSASHPPPPPIRPSRTLTETEAELAPNTTTQESNSTLEVTATVIPTPPESNEATVNPPSDRDNGTLVVETVPLDTGSLDSLFSELEQAVVPSPRTPPAPQKESVFVRLANRIKALERNMSLSGQYLEELSRRYKRQVEELQRAVGEGRRRSEEREGVLMEQLAQQAQQMEALTGAVKELLEERDSWQHKATVMGQHGVIVLVEVVVFAVILYICRWIPEVDVSRRKFSMPWPRVGNTGSVSRRKSVDQVLPQSSVPAKKRRPSEEALIIAGSTHQELLLPEAKRKVSKGETRRQRRKRRKELLLLENERAPTGSTSLLDQNGGESVAAWWETEEVASVPPVPAVVLPPPQYVQTAVAQRQDRIGRSSSENSDKENKTFLPIKKPGPFKKIVKKFF
ncbi:SUN domain-containing ossification factor [Macrosteles quadrilineatus]|uniref:SUN domain-containing ossification factor n=1 Tax=Macrosteles quadrilineatus TaxID=74068 RepID=UPI0023E27541|nr:SUN domain-containing ossification factor [Macrosteles quadrilineatus]